LLAVVEAPSLLDALIAAQRPNQAHASPMRFALVGPAADEAASRLDRPETIMLTDERNWITGVHAGLRRTILGIVPEAASGSSNGVGP
jgi:hypothetical protein